MDIKKSITKIFHRRKQSHFPLLLGAWEFEENLPEGFIIRNTKQKEEWHFDSTSNGWITGLNTTNKMNPSIICVNTKGFPGYAPVLMDKASIKHRAQQRAQTEKNLRRG